MYLKISKFNYLFIYLLGVQTHQQSYGDFKLLLVEENPTGTNIGIFACVSKTTDALQVSWKTSPHERFCPDQKSNPHGEWMSSYKSKTLTS